VCGGGCLDGGVVAAGEDSALGGGQSAHSAAVSSQRRQALERIHVPHAHLHFDETQGLLSRQEWMCLLCAPAFFDTDKHDEGYRQGASWTQPNLTGLLHLKRTRPHSSTMHALEC
jgi:hypothetical protein